MHRLTASLNPEQRRAVETTQGPLLVLAGAGTGKTRVITHRIAYLIEGGTLPESILAMTFTNKAASEMKQRVAQLTSPDAGRAITIGTFHSFCARCLREFAEVVGIRKTFAICDASDQLMSMKNALRELRIPEATIHPRACIAKISLLKNRLISPEQFLASSVDDVEELIGRAYRRYNEGLRRSSLLDFDDLLIYMVKLLDDKPTLRHFRERYKYLLIDEYQDTNGVQYEIVKRIGSGHNNVCVVGDDDQSIYSWRGADISKILNFSRDFPKAVVIRLETNYRSTTQILDGANAVIRNNPARHEKSLRSAEGSGEPIRVVELEHEDEEADFVVEEILKRLRDDSSRHSDFAILFRTQVQPRVFETRLRQNHIPYILVGGMSFFDRKEVRDVLAYLKILSNPADEVSLLRVINVPPRGVGKTTIDRAMNIAAEEGLLLTEVFERGDKFPELPQGAVTSVREFLRTIGDLRSFTKGAQLVDMIRLLLRDVNYRAEVARCYSDERTRLARWGAVNEILNMAENYVTRSGKKGPTLAGLLEEMTLSATDETDDDDSSNNAVTLMTLHSAKGLEFPQVYLVGAEEGLLPHIRSIQENSIEEERRLAYVGITRAKRRLTITYAGSRARYGKRVKTMRSRFIYEMNNEVPPLHEIAAMLQEMSRSQAPAEIDQEKSPPKKGRASAKKKSNSKKKKKKKKKKAAIRKKGKEPAAKKAATRVAARKKAGTKTATKKDAGKTPAKTKAGKTPDKSPKATKKRKSPRQKRSST